MRFRLSASEGRNRMVAQMTSRNSSRSWKVRQHKQSGAFWMPNIGSLGIPPLPISAIGRSRHSFSVATRFSSGHSNGSFASRDLIPGAMLGVARKIRQCDCVSGSMTVSSRQVDSFTTPTSALRMAPSRISERLRWKRSIAKWQPFTVCTASITANARPGTDKEISLFLPSTLTGNRPTRTTPLTKGRGVCHAQKI